MMNSSDDRTDRSEKSNPHRISTFGRRRRRTTLERMFRRRRSTYPSLAWTLYIGIKQIHCEKIVVCLCHRGALFLFVFVVWSSSYVKVSSPSSFSSASSQICVHDSPSMHQRHWKNWFSFSLLLSPSVLWKWSSLSFRANQSLLYMQQRIICFSSFLFDYCERKVFFSFCFVFLLRLILVYK